jgi:uncharacterized membrane protein
MVGLGDLPGSIFNSNACAASDGGAVVVGYGYSVAAKEAFIWDESNGMRNLKSVLQTEYGLDLTGWTLVEAYGISADGRTIAGHGNHNGVGEAWVVTIPEPAGLAAIGIAFVACASGRKRRP